jgi:NADH:ubiquinone oxidoreductase subunit B-like Fe-S oxidoreductase
MGLNDKIEKDGFLTTKLDAILNWCKKNSLWPMPMGRDDGNSRSKI